VFRCLSRALLEGVEDIHGFGKRGDVEHSVFQARMNPDLPDARTNGGHRFPVVRIETLLDAPELEARVPPRIGGEGAQGGQGAAEPRDGLVRHASIYKFLYVWVKRHWVTLGWWRPRGNEVEESETLCKMIAEGGACMEMAYRERWKAAIAEMRRVLGGFPMKEECKWGKPTYTVDGNNVVITQGFKECFALGFFQGALLKDPKKVLVQLGQVQAGRVMKFTGAKDIRAKAATIKAYVREAIAAEKAGLRMKKRSTSEFPVPEELTQRFRRAPRFKRAFEALTPGRQRSYLHHFAAAKQSATRVARIERAMPAIFEGRGFLERR
jgi:uncharacterized protein YdeI (YjbR/CyaY-like superfamily)